ncbi:MAG: hypothetical protein LBH61_00200 [Dysgonamonadaceae bacterium]|nr:hypothetical protein [Dysgonamonadaceae bacterium]
MKKFISTKLFLALQEASQKGIDIDARVLENSYDKFVRLLFSENAASTNKVAYHNALVYIRVELACLTEIPEKKKRRIISAKPLMLLTGRWSLSVGKCKWKRHKVARFLVGYQNAAICNGQAILSSG